MRTLAIAGAVGAGLGAVVAVAAHFMSHTLPSHYTVGFYQFGDQMNLGSPPMVHPSWLPFLPVAIVVGAGVAIGIAFAAGRAGLRLTHRSDARP